MSLNVSRMSLKPRSPLLRGLALATLIGTLAILGGATRAEAKRGRARAGRAPAAAAADCKTDKDCVVVVVDCCPCSEGGKQRAIPRKEKPAYEKDRKKRCEGTMCTEAVSQDPSCSQRAFCGAGICELRDSSSEAAP
jgi:hypothetical protein